MIFRRLSQGRAGQADAALFAEGQRLPITVDFVRQNAFQPAAIAVIEAVDGLPEPLRFIVRLKVQPLNPGVPIYQTDVQLRPKFSVGMGLSPDNGAYPGLGQTDDSPWNAVDSTFKHETLPFVNGGHQIHAIFLWFGQFHAILYELDDISYIPPDILKLFSAGGTDCLGAALFALGQSPKVTPGALAVHPRFLFPGAFADLVHCLFQLLPRLIEQIYSFRTERSEGIFAMF